MMDLLFIVFPFCFYLVATRIGVCETTMPSMRFGVRMLVWGNIKINVYRRCGSA
jgi:hypothetical protein